MANTYDAEAIGAAAGASAAGAAAAPDDTEGAGEKISHEQCQYQPGTPLKNCGLCANFNGSVVQQDRCTKVVDPISAFGYCNVYARQENPFGHTYAQGQQTGAPTRTSLVEPETPQEDAAPDEEPDQPPGVQIGNRRYAG